MAISNQLSIRFNFNEINNAYDFYIISTSDKYISGGAYLLDKPIDSLKAESVVFDNGRSVFLMFKKGVSNRLDLVNQLIDEKLTIKQVSSENIKDYILFRLFLYSLSNFESDDNKFNNVSGKLYITRPKWMSKNKKTFKCLNINVDDKLCLTAEATTFTQTSLFTNKKILNEYPKYTFSNKNGALKRTFDSDSETYIRRSLFGKKAEISYLDFSKSNIENNKVFFIYKTIRMVSERFLDLLTVKFKEITVTKTIGKYIDDDFVNKSINLLKGRTLNLVNWSNSDEFIDEFNAISTLVKSKNVFKVVESKTINKNALNLVYLHNKEYYEQMKYNDPYKKFVSSAVIQHITIEDCADKLVDDNEAIINTIFKEFAIKLDIAEQSKISLDDWSLFNYSERMIFGREKNNIHYFMIINPEGSFEFKRKANDLRSFGDKALDKCSRFLTDNLGKDKSIIVSENNAIVISRTGSFTLPSEKIFSLETISRSNESRKAYFDGVVDVNLYDNLECFYNAGIKGSGMNTLIPKAPILYKVECIEGHNFIDKIIESLAVPFVKYKNFTVLPYPFKYLNEYIETCEKTVD